MSMSHILRPYSHSWMFYLDDLGLPVTGKYHHFWMKVGQICSFNRSLFLKKMRCYFREIGIFQPSSFDAVTEIHNSNLWAPAKD